MPTSFSLLKLFRRTHRYIGVFIAPALLFFAFTGALQTIGLHEPIKGTSYKPARWIVVLAQLHKHQTADLPVRKPQPKPDTDAKPKAAITPPETHHAEASSPALTPSATPTQPPAKEKYHIPIKAFFLIVCLGLFTSTLTGIYMAYKFDPNRWLITGLLIAGIVIPLASLPF